MYPVRSGDRMGIIIVGHKVENRYLGHKFRPSRHYAGSLIKASGRRCRDSPKSLSGRNSPLEGGDPTPASAGGHVRQYNQYMHSLFKGQITRPG